MEGVEIKQDHELDEEEKDAFEWPKHKMTQRLQRMDAKLSGVLLNLSRPTWQTAVSDSSIRVNIRNVLEAEQTLATCEFTSLIDKNKEQKAKWLATQALLKVMKTYRSSPSDEVLCSLSEHFDVLRPFVCRKGRTFFVGLQRYDLWAAFLCKLGDEGVKAAIDVLALGADGGKAAKMYGELLAADPGVQPARFQDWIECSLIENAAKTMLRTMDMSISCRSAELDRAGTWFARYQEAVQAESFLSDGMKKRALAMVTLHKSLVGQPVAAADVDRSMRVLSAFPNLEISRAYKNYRAGQEYIMQAAGAVARNAEDVLADAALSDLKARLCSDEAEDELGFQVSMERLANFEDLMVKLYQSIGNWSELRFEEQSQELNNTVLQLLGLPLKADMELVSLLRSALEPGLMATIEEKARAQSDSASDTYPGELMRLRGVVLRLSTSLDANLEVMTATIKSCVRLCEHTLPEAHKKKLKKHEKIDFTSEVAVLRGSVGRWKCIQSLFRVFLSSVALEVDFADSSDYNVALGEWQQWLQNRPSGDAAKKKPYLWHIMEFSEKRDDINTGADVWVPFVPVPALSLTPNMVEDMNRTVTTLIAFASTSVFAGRVARLHCEIKLCSCISFWVGKVASHHATLVGAATLADTPIKAIVPLLVGREPATIVDLKKAREQLSMKAMHQGDVSKLTSTTEFEMVKKMVSQVASGHLHIACLQADGGVGLDKRTLQSVLTVHSAVNLVIVLAACIHDEISESEKHPTAAPPEAMIEAIRLLRGSLDSLGGLVHSPPVMSIDNVNHRLHKSITYFREWQASAQCFCDKAVEKVKLMFCAALSSVAGKLEQSIPTWRAFITDAKMNDTLAKTKLLQSPHRSSWSSEGTSLHNMLRRAAAASQVLAVDVPFDRDETFCGSQDLATAAIKSAYEAVAVCAGCNAVLLFGGKPQGPGMAAKVVKIVASMEGFDLPTTLRQRLAELVERDGSGQGSSPAAEAARPPSSDTQLEEDSQADTQPPAKRPRWGKGMLLPKAESQS